MHIYKLIPFFQESPFIVHRTSTKDAKLPRVTIREEEAIVVALRVAKAGYYGGDLEKILKAEADLVLKALHYSNFCTEYEEEYMELNK